MKILPKLPITEMFSEGNLVARTVEKEIGESSGKEREKK